MKVPSGIEWYNILILGLAVVGIVVNLSCLVLLVKRRKCSMFYTLIKVKSHIIHTAWTVKSLDGAWSTRIRALDDLGLGYNSTIYGLDYYEPFITNNLQPPRLRYCLNNCSNSEKTVNK